MKSQESQWCDSVQGQRPEPWGARGKCSSLRLENQEYPYPRAGGGGHLLSSWDSKFIFPLSFVLLRASLVAQMVKNLPAMQEIQVQSLDWKDPLEKWMATHSSILAWRIPLREEPGGLQSMGSQRIRYNWVTNTLTCSIRPSRDWRAFKAFKISPKLGRTVFQWKARRDKKAFLKAQPWD